MEAGRGRDAGASFEAVLDKKLLSVTNTMDSIQGLSAWCIEYKKYHGMIVRQWIKCLKKSATAHQLNLFYLANDVIQNCKRKNALVYRTAFADVLPEAFVLIKQEGDAKVVKSAQRILTIWQERSVYSDALIAELRAGLVKEESPPATPAEQKTPVESKSDLRSKIVAEFVPQSLIDHLSKYKRSLEDVDLREKQLAAMRVDICSSEALKKLKDKAGGKKFSRDFEEGNTQLQEFVKFFDRANKTGPLLLEALSNADIFYELQYKEVKIVANAYQTFANRVSHLKRKLDNLKATLPDLDDSPIPSPSADAPSPTGSESPFRDLDPAGLFPEPDAAAATENEAEPPAPSPLSSIGDSPKHLSNLAEDNVNREVEDMELSDDEIVGGGIIVEQQMKSPGPKVETPHPVSQNAEPSVASDAAASLDTVDLGKIGSILSSLNAAMKSTAGSVKSSVSRTVLPMPPPLRMGALPPNSGGRSSSMFSNSACALGCNAGPPAESPSATTPFSSAETLRPACEEATSLVDILAKVDMSPADLLSALSKVQGQGGLEGIATLLSSPTANVPAESSDAGEASASASAAPDRSAAASPAAPTPSLPSDATVPRSAAAQTLPESGPTAAPAQDGAGATAWTADVAKPDSLESKIHNFLHGNPAFSNFDLSFALNLPNRADDSSPVAGADTRDGTPVRDEGGGTPTQDEFMDVTMGLPESLSAKPESGMLPAPFAFQEIPPRNPGAGASRPAQNGQLYQAYPYGEDKASDPAAPYAPVSTPGGDAGAGTQTVEGFRGPGDPAWYGETYPEGGFQQPTGYNAQMPAANQASGSFEYQVQETEEPASFQQPSDFFRSLLPPVPKLPPPPNILDQQQAPHADVGQAGQSGGGGGLPRMVVHDHGHKSVFRPQESLYDGGDGPRSAPDHLRYPEDREHYRDDAPPQPGPRFHASPYNRLQAPFYQRGGPRHNPPRGRARFASPPSPAPDAFGNPEYQSPPRPHFALRHPPPHPHLQMRPSGLRPPPRPPHPGLAHPFPRGPPRAPFPTFHDPRLRGKRPCPRGGLNPGPVFAPKRPFPPPHY